MKTLRDKLAALRSRISGAQVRRDTWRASRNPEKYLEACSRVDALEAEFDALTRSGYHYDRFADAIAYARLDRGRGCPDVGHETQPMQPRPPPTEDDLVRMQALDVTFENGVFHWRGFRYDRLADALAYAALQAQGERS